MLFDFKKIKNVFTTSFFAALLCFVFVTPVFALSTNTSTAPVLKGVQGYNPDNDTYSNGSATIGQYLILYGSFASSGNTVTVGGKQLTPDYQSIDQINVPLTADLGLAAGSTNITVSNAFGSSSPISFQVVAANSTVPPNNTPPNNNPPKGTTPAGTPPGANPPQGDNSVPSSAACGDLGLEDQDGVCLPNNPYSKGEGISGSRKIGDVITKVLTILLTLAGVVAVLFIVIGGFQYMTARGNEEQATKGRKTFVTALIGLIAILLAYTIVNIIYQTVTKGSIFS